MQDDLTLRAYHYDLPEENIAQSPADRRDESRLLVLDKASGSRTHLRFNQIQDYFAPGDLLVTNDTRVFPARLFGSKETGGKAEVFLLRYPRLAAADNPEPGRHCFTSEALIKTSRRPRPGTRITMQRDCSVTLMENLGRGTWSVQLSFSATTSLEEVLQRQGQIPLPPYIKRSGGPSSDDAERYQTVYANQPGAVAAPTAGLHFTESLLTKLAAQGVNRTAITLHVGYGTFAPVEKEDITRHAIHHEYLEISREAAELVNTTRDRGGKIWAVGTTAIRALEFSARDIGECRPIKGMCDLYIVPGYRFQLVDNVITNFHLPQSSLLFLIAALCGRTRLLACYQEAIERGYRFYSYGDAMAIIK